MEGGSGDCDCVFNRIDVYLPVAHETVHDGEAGICRSRSAAAHLLWPGHPGWMWGHLHPRHLTLKIFYLTVIIIIYGVLEGAN